jgi:hypothetical protein
MVGKKVPKKFEKPLDIFGLPCYHDLVGANRKGIDMQDSTRELLKDQLDLARYLYQNPQTNYGEQGGTLSERLERYDEASRRLREYDQQ